MAVFGWIMFSLLAIFGLGILVIFVIPFVVTESRMMGEKIKRAIDDKKFDLDKRSEARRRRDEIKRERDFELANRRLDAKLLKVDKQIKLQEQKLELAKQYKEQRLQEKEELEQSTPIVKKHPKAPKHQHIEEVVEEPQDVVEELIAEENETQE